MNENNDSVKNWLEQLQRESWNLELLISGFSIFLLIQTMKSFEALLSNVTMIFSGDLLLAITLTFVNIVYVSTIILTINLVAHIFLRGFWIGAIGLRSVQSKPEFEKLRYSAFFKYKLQRLVGDLDTVLNRLDVVCSAIFSFTFLIIFMLISLFLFILSAAIWITLISELSEIFPAAEDTLDLVGSLIAMVYVLLGFVYFIDTLTLGFFKRFGWLSRIYYPIYKFIGWVTAARIYRSIYYYLITRFPKNVIRIILAFYLLGAILIPTTNYDDYMYWPDNHSSFHMHSAYYDDQRTKEVRIRTACIPSATISGSWLPLFIRYNIANNALIQQNCPDFEPAKRGGFQSGIQFSSDGVSISTPSVEEPQVDSLLHCLTSVYVVTLNDSTYTDLPFRYYSHPHHEEKGIFTMMRIDHLPTDDYVLDIRLKDGAELKPFVQIPFWRE